MYETEFDRFAEEYRTIHAQNIRLSGESPEFFTAYKITDVAREMSAACTVPNPRILDFGAGVGNSVPFFQRWLTPSVLVCLDVSRKSLAIGQERFRELADFIAFDGQPYPSPTTASILSSRPVCFTIFPMSIMGESLRSCTGRSRLPVCW